MLPPICTSLPASRRMWATSAVVVDLPFVPVMATKGAAGAILPRSRQNSSMSPMISTPARFASAADQCGSGWVNGTPGDRTRAAKRDQSAVFRSPVPIPLSRAAARLAGLSSQATTSAPPACRASAVTSPEPPSPNSATVLPAKVVAGVTLALSQHEIPDQPASQAVRDDRGCRLHRHPPSPELEGGEPDQGENEGDDPEADHDLRLHPALLLEMVMKGRH